MPMPTVVPILGACACDGRAPGSRRRNRRPACEPFRGRSPAAVRARPCRMGLLGGEPTRWSAGGRGAPPRRSPPQRRRRHLRDRRWRVHDPLQDPRPPAGQGVHGRSSAAQNRGSERSVDPGRAATATSWAPTAAVQRPAPAPLPLQSTSRAAEAPELGTLTGTPSHRPALPVCRWRHGLKHGRPRPSHARVRALRQRDRGAAKPAACCRCPMCCKSR